LIFSSSLSGGTGEAPYFRQHHHVGGGGLRAVERREIDAGLEGPSSVEARK
jgi:hypothetical protein